MNLSKITHRILLLSLGIFLFGAGFRFGQYRPAQIEKQSYTIRNMEKPSVATGKNIDFSLFWDAWDRVEQKFIDKNKIDEKKMFYGAVKGMVSSLEDPYTFFLTPEENKESKKDLGGRFEGIGAQLGLKENRIIIIAPLKSSPAEKAGVKAGDFVNKVNSEMTGGWTLPQAVNKIRGEKGSKVKLTLERKNKEFEVEIVRDEIKVQSVELSYETKNAKKIALLKLNQFGDNTNNEWDAAVNQIETDWRNKSISGMILDLRDNPGGYLESSVYLASEFLPKGAVVVKQTSTIHDDKTYQADQAGRLQNIPLIIIINKGSASASEILAGSLRDHKRAILIGEKSFGKGSVQEALDLKDGAGLHVTVAKWILPKGSWINGKGIEPDITIENKIEEGNSLTRESDKQLERAVSEVIK